MDREQMHSLIEQIAGEVNRRLARKDGGQGRRGAHRYVWYGLCKYD